MKKIMCITLAVLLMACSQAMANFSGADDFNSPSLDVSKWAVSPMFSSSLAQASGKLTFSSPGINTDEGLEWILNIGSYTQSWVATVDAEVSEPEIAFSSNRMMCAMVVVPDLAGGFSGSPWFDVNLEKNRDAHGVTGYFHGVNTVPGDDDTGELVYGPQLTNASVVTLRISYDAAIKTLKSSYDAGEGFVDVATFSVVSWGMDSGDIFTIHLACVSEGITSSSGSATLDNFTVLSGAEYTLNEDAQIYCSSIVGSWINGDPTTKDSVMITFMADGTYFLSHDSSAGFAGGLGMERGTYTWNSGSGAFVANVTVDTNGEGGLSHPGGGSATVSIDGDAMLYKPVSEDGATLTRVNYATTPPSIIGGWKHIGFPVPTHDNVVMTFLPNGIYFFAQDGDSVYDPSGQDGMERGVYTWNSSTGAFSATALTDTCGEWGLSHIGSPTFVVNGNEMLLDGSFLLERVVDPLCSDIDGDGLPDVWEQQYFSNPTNATAGGHGDSDTLDNRGEYVAGTDPTDGSSLFVITNAIPDLSGFVLNWTAVEGRSYGVKWTGSLTNSFSVLTNDIAYPQSSYTDTVHSAEGEGFYIIDVKLKN